MAPTPVTIITGFLGAGKTTLILNLIPQLPRTYKLALLKNEFGDLAIDSQLASSASIGGVKELLNGCICCNLVGQLGDALQALRNDVSPDRIVIETSGSAFPATLAMEINRLARETGDVVLDGVVVVIDVENWKGYEDTSYTAKMQARFTDLIILNKWELVDERKHEECLDRVGDLEVQVATVRSEKGRVNQDLLLGLDSALAKDDPGLLKQGHVNHHSPHDHQSEVEVLSVTLTSAHQASQAINLDKLETFLSSAPKDEIYRIKAILLAGRQPKSSDNSTANAAILEQPISRYIVNWAFGRWTFTPMSSSEETQEETVQGTLLQMTVVLAKYEADKWAKQIKAQSYLTPKDPNTDFRLDIQRLL